MKKKLLIISGLVKIGLFLLAVLFFASCSNRGYQTISQSSISTDSSVAVFNNDFEKALYQTTINIFKTQLTGITLIKKTDSSYRVVSMSEIGVKYFDVEVFVNSTSPAKVHYIMEVLNRKLLVSMILNDFQLLFSEPVDPLKIKTENQIRKSKNGNLVYYDEFSKGITQIRKSRFLFTDKLLISLGRTNPISPDSILINHGKINFEYIRIEN